MIIVRDFNTLDTSMDTSSRNKINKVTEILNDTIESLDLIDIFRTLHQKNQNIHWSAHRTFSRIDHILRHKTNLNKFKTIEIITYVFSDHNDMKIEIDNRKRNEKKTDYMETKQLKNQLVN